MDRFGTDHHPHLSTLHSHRSEQADLMRAFEHREHQRVDDADERDDHGEREQRVDQAEQLIDLRLLRFLEGCSGLYLEAGIGVEAAGDRLGGGVVRVGGRQEHGDR